MKALIIWITLVCIVAARACDIQSDNINLIPKDDVHADIELDAVKSISVAGKNEYVTINIRDDGTPSSATITLHNMEKYHRNRASAGNVEQIHVELQLECENRSKLTRKFTITLTFANVFTPQLLSPNSASDTIVYTLPMPFPPMVDLSWFQEIHVEDIDMYNTGLEFVESPKFKAIAISIPNTKAKQFKISLNATDIISSEMKFDLQIKDKPYSENEPVDSKVLTIKIEIRKDNANSILSFDMVQYSADWDLEKMSLNIPPIKLSSPDATVTIKGDYDNCFKCIVNKNGNVDISTETCTLPYKRAFLNLQLEALAKDSEITATSSLFITIHKKHFDKNAYAGKLNSGKLDLEVIKLIGAENNVKIETGNPVLECVKGTCKEAECIIKCEVPKGIPNSLLETEIIAFTEGIADSEISAQVIINEVNKILFFEDIECLEPLNIDQPNVDPIVTAKLTLSNARVEIDGPESTCFEVSDVDSTGKVYITYKYCDLLYGKTYLDLKLVAFTPGASASANVIVTILEKHFVESSYVGTFDNGKLVLEEIKLQDAGGAINLHVDNPILSCSVKEHPCPNGDCIIKCEITNDFEEPVLKVKVTAFRRGTTISKRDLTQGVSTTIVINNLAASGGNGNGNDANTGESDNTGLIAAVSVLGVLLVVVLIVGAILYRRLRKSLPKETNKIEDNSPKLSAQLNPVKTETDANSDNGSFKPTPLNSPKPGLLRKIEQLQPEISEPPTEPPPTLNNTYEEADSSKITFVKKPIMDRDSMNLKYDRRATGYPQNPPSISDLETVDYAPSEESTLPAYSLNNKEDDLESVMTTDTTKSVSFNPTVKHSVLFEDIND